MADTKNGLAERLAPLLKEAVACGIRQRELLEQLEMILAGPEVPEAARVHVETVLTEWIDDQVMDFETAEGYGAEDAKLLLEEVANVG